MLDRERESYSRPIDQELSDAAARLLGDPELNLKPTVLFGEVAGLEKQVRTAGTERLLAAWYYLAHRFDDKTRTTDQALGKRYVDFGNRLSVLLRDSEPDRAKQIYRDVRAFEERRQRSEELEGDD
ncbi:MAG: hypothetical protein ABIP48_01230 [Planctomycetota bacterium]